MKIENLGKIDAGLQKFLGLKEKFAEADLVLLRIDGVVRGKEICLFAPVLSEVSAISAEKIEKYMRQILSEVE